MNSQSATESSPKLLEQRPKIKKVLLNEKFAQNEITHDI
jgi:hypothetical protein